MAGLRTVIRVAKSIDRAHKQSVREAERRRKREARESARQQREYERSLRQKEKERVAIAKAEAAKKKVLFKQDLEDAKASFETRCNHRKELRQKFVKQELR